MVFSPAAVDASHAAAAHAFRRMAELAGGATQDRSGLLLYHVPVPDSLVWNGAIVAPGGDADPAELLARADAFFEHRVEAYGFWVVASRDKELALHLAAQGAEQVDDAPHMLLHCAAEPTAPPSALTVDLVDDQAGRDAFVTVAAAAFETIGADPEVWPVAYPDTGSLCADDVITVVARDGDVPVGAAVGYLHDGLCEVIHVATVPPARRRGTGALVTGSVVSEARNRGATTAVLQATEHGEGVYRALGFVEVDRYRLHLRELSR